MAQTLTTEQLSERLRSLETQFNGLVTVINTMNDSINTRVKASDLSRTESRLEQMYNDNFAIIQKLEEKLALIKTPTDTRYYLVEAEVEDFRANFNKLLAMMNSFETLYKNLVAYAAVNTTT